MRLYLAYIGMLIRTQLIHRTSFMLLFVGQFFLPFTSFLGFSMLFMRFGNIGGYSYYEMALCYGIIHSAYSISETITRGFDVFAPLVREATFDRILLRPRNLVLQVLGTQFEMTRIGRLFQSFVVLGIALNGLSTPIDALKIALMILMILSGVVVFTSIFILTATLCFWTVEGTELANIFTDGGRELGQFPLDIYAKKFRLFFTFVIPFGMVNYYPLLAVLGRTPISIVNFLTPLYAFVFLAFSLLVWYRGVRYYHSSGS